LPRASRRLDLPPYLCKPSENPDNPRMTDQVEYGRHSAWRDTEGFSEAKARDQARRLEHRAQAEDEASARGEYLTLLGLSPGERVLDVGCGSGVVTRAIAERIAPNGKVTDTDSSAALLEVAREYADKGGIGGLVDWRVADCRELPFPDALFDAVLAATVLAHVPGAERALAEMVRVTRPGGRVAVFDFDGDGLLFTHPDRHLTRRIVAAQCDHFAVNGNLIREMPGLMTRLGVRDVRAKAFMPLEREAGSFYAEMAKRAGTNAASVGAISESELAGWLAELSDVLKEGRFLGGRLQVFVWGAAGARGTSTGRNPP
jgi:SAM-dependent methyltransferase